MLVPELEQPDGEGASARNAVCSADIWTLRELLCQKAFALQMSSCRGQCVGPLLSQGPSQFLEMLLFPVGPRVREPQGFSDRFLCSLPYLGNRSLCKDCGVNCDAWLVDKGWF